MFKIIKFLSIFFITSFAIANEVESNLNIHSLNEFQCESLEREFCFIRGQEFLATSTDPIDRLRPRKPVSSFQSKKTQIGLVFIHGLYSNPSQFINIERTLDKSGTFILEVNLPGHGLSKSHSDSVTFKDWIEEVKRAIMIARTQSEKIVLVGQSAGGMLAIDAALNNDTKSLIHGLILIEPAIKLLPLNETLVSLPTQIKEGLIHNKTIQEKVKSIYGRRWQINGILNMAFQVNELRKHILKKLSKPDSLYFIPELEYFLSTLNLFIKYNIELIDSFNIGKNIEVPILLMINRKDQLVSVYHQQSFMLGHQLNQSFESQSTYFNQWPHGRIALSENGQEYVLSNIIQFLDTHF